MSGRFFEIVKQEVGPTAEEHEWRDASGLVEAADRLAEAVEAFATDTTGADFTKHASAISEALVEYRRLRGME